MGIELLPKISRQTKISHAFIAIIVAMLFIFGTPLITSAKSSSPGPCIECDQNAIQALFPPETEITINSVTKEYRDNFPMPFCLVDGSVITHGPGDEDGIVNFRVSLPDKFINRYLFSALGGSAGYLHDPITDPTYAFYHNTSQRLIDGYAVATSDTGSQTPGCEYGFAWNRTKAFDHDQRGVHLSAVITQAITKAYYGLDTKHKKRKCASKKLYRYIMGGSGGGRSGMVSAIHYPEDFDGYIVGWPGLNPYNQVFFGKIASFIMNNPGAWISLPEFQQLEADVIAQFDGSDGALDGLIWDYTKINYDLESLGIFSPLQLEALEIITGGINFDGKSYYPGFPLTNPSGWSMLLIGMEPPPWEGLPGVLQCFNTSSIGLYGPGYDFLTEFDFNNPEDYFDWAETYGEVFPGSGTQEPSELDGLRRSGGKMVIFHGVSDNAIAVGDTIRFYDELADLNHGYGRTQTFARLFLAPGVFHGYGGPGAAANDIYEQALEGVVRWVENGKPPKELKPKSALPAEPRTYLLCPYPQKSEFLGGDVNDASNWICRKPEPSWNNWKKWMKFNRNYH
ncbi:MAG: tannase/feruloyl esterase family alpha/beta hydrolase [Pseudomonadota bacterium]